MGLAAAAARGKPAKSRCCETFLTQWMKCSTAERLWHTRIRVLISICYSVTLRLYRNKYKAWPMLQNDQLGKPEKGKETNDIGDSGEKYSGADRGVDAGS